MTDTTTRLKALRRPRLLIRAARCGVGDYIRARDLKRVLRRTELPTPSRAVSALLDAEAGMEEARRAGDQGYNPQRHVDILIALMGEARLLSLDTQAA
ncbi:DUF6477 family protein [Celeribacter sp.]|uniref:DUF6477 family protein n=1 Tax=Celeribacter sp. TaxID=1890673 RepID=UPI003A8D8C72